jgi:hypothetical protein
MLFRHCGHQQVLLLGGSEPSLINLSPFRKFPRKCLQEFWPRKFVGAWNLLRKTCAPGTLALGWG